MRTYKPFSTISYNTPTFLKNQLDTLVSMGVLKKYMFISHKGELGAKDHIHVFLDPIQTIDTNTGVWKDFFKEAVENGDPLNVMPFEKSKDEDWLLYALHDREYLDFKGLTKVYYDYPVGNVVCNVPCLPEELYRTIDKSKFASPIARMIQCAEAGLNLYQAMAKLRIPYASMRTFKDIYRDVQIMVGDEQLATADTATGELFENADPTPINVDDPLKYGCRDNFKF